MPRIDPQRNAALDELFEAILCLENLEECRAFFGDLFTMQELLSFTSRLQVARLLLQGETYQSVRSQVAVSSSTITRISTELQFGSGGYRTVLERLQKRADARAQEPPSDRIP